MAEALSMEDGRTPGWTRSRVGHTDRDGSKTDIEEVDAAFEEAR
jgi:hypothetical protein